MRHFASRACTRTRSNERPPRSKKLSCDADFTRLPGLPRHTEAISRSSLPIAVRLCRLGAVGAGSERLSILPFAVRGKGRKVLDSRWNHRSRQPSAEIFPQRLGGCLSGEVSNQLTVAQNHRRGFHQGVGGELALDFARFDPQSAELDLLIEPAQELQCAVGQPPHPVAGTVKTLALFDARSARQSAPAFADNRVPSPLRSATVRRAPRSATASPCLSSHHRLHVGNRAAQSSLLPRDNVGGGRHACGFRWPVDIPEFCSRHRRNCACGKRLRKALAAKDDRAQAAPKARRVAGLHRVENRFPLGRNTVERDVASLAEFTRQHDWIHDCFFRWDPHRAAGDQWTRTPA